MHYSFFDKMMERIDEVHKLMKFKLRLLSIHAV